MALRHDSQAPLVGSGSAACTADPANTVLWLIMLYVAQQGRDSHVSAFAICEESEM